MWPLIFLLSLCGFGTIIVFHFFIKKRDTNYLATHLCKELNDPDGYAYYEILVHKVGTKEILSALEATKKVARQRKLRNKAAYFVGILRKRGFPVKFRY